MPQETLEFRITFRKLLMGLFITVVPICLVALYSVAESRKNLERTIGAQFKNIAESTATEIADFIHGEVVEVALMAADSAVEDAVVEANRSYQGFSDSAFNEKVKRIEKIWNTPESTGMVKQMLSSRASRSLRRYRELDGKFLRITVTDERGATVAATHKTRNYYQADEPYWQDIYAGGRGAISLTDIEYDEVTKSNYIGIGVPILEEGSNRFIGTLDALIEVSSIFPIVKRAQTGAGTRALLVRQDGSVIISPNVSLPANLKSAEYAAVTDAFGALQGRQSGYLVANLRGMGNTMTGYADSGLKQDYQKLAWVALVSQPVADAFGPVRTTERLIILMAVLGLIAATVLSVYFSIHKKGEIEEIEEEFHPPISQ
ncbi:MAG: cache domain-containing protein [Acidobacteria bacterium]|nr:cache domain-containing protein [Acidobacteriota bacterium]